MFFPTPLASARNTPSIFKQFFSQTCFQYPFFKSHLSNKIFIFAKHNEFMCLLKFIWFYSVFKEMFEKERILGIFFICNWNLFNNWNFTILNHALGALPHKILQKAWKMLWNIFFLSFILTDVLTLRQDGNCLLTLLFGRKHVMLTLWLGQKTYAYSQHWTEKTEVTLSFFSVWKVL